MQGTVLPLFLGPAGRGGFPYLICILWVGPFRHELSLSGPVLTLPHNTPGILTDSCGIYVGGTGSFPDAENKPSQLLGGSCV